MKFDGLLGEREILSFKLANGVGWLTAHRLIIEQEKLNPRFNIMEREEPEMYLLKDFEKAEIRGETLIAYFSARIPSAEKLYFQFSVCLFFRRDNQEKRIQGKVRVLRRCINSIPQSASIVDCMVFNVRTIAAYRWLIMSLAVLLSFTPMALSIAKSSSRLSLGGFSYWSRRDGHSKVDRASYVWTNDFLVD